MIVVKDLALPEVKLLMLKMHHDDRGHLIETFKESTLKEAGFPSSFPQENQSFSKRVGTVRGLHAQKPPHAQAKLVRVLKGRIFDVAVDIRENSNTFGHHASATLSADEPALMLIPEGFLHGFCTLDPDTVVLYKMTRLYAVGEECGVLWNDPSLQIPWPTSISEATLSEKDKGLPLLKDLPRINWS